MKILMALGGTVRGGFALLAAATAILATSEVVRAADVAAKTCSQADVQAAINTARNGDRVLVPRGTCWWGTTVNIPNTKGITLQGAGIGGTTIIYAIVDKIPALRVLISATVFTRVTGFTFDANGVDYGGAAFLSVEGIGSHSKANFRVDHARFANLLRRGLTVYPPRVITGNVLYGVIDHNEFVCPYNANCQGVTVYGGPAGDSTMFKVPAEFGTAKSVYIENNTFTFAYSNDASVEAYNGARMVVRFNTGHLASYGAHGADSSNARGTMAYEVYGNSNDIAGCLGSCTGNATMGLRSGTGFIFSNAWEKEAGPLLLSVYRAGSDWISPRSAYLGAGGCNGSNPVDGNEGRYPAPGRPCIDQTGTLFTDALDGTHAHAPLYVFGNTRGGSRYGAITGNKDGDATHILENTDFYNEPVSFDGKLGVGVGLISARPATCTTGVAYWATDEGEWNSSHAGADGRLYKCTSTNRWTLHYTPYTYPHPMTQASPTAPTNLMIR